jgi:hypothetical protein
MVVVKLSVKMLLWQPCTLMAEEEHMRHCQGYFPEFFQNDINC